MLFRSYKLEDSREVKVEFIEFKDGVKVVETFDAEDENSEIGRASCRERV